MRTYRTGVVGGILAGACSLVLMFSLAVQEVAQARKGSNLDQSKVAYTSVEAAYRTGIGAYHLGRMKIALHALEYAAGKGNIPAKLWLARIYSGASVGLRNVERDDLRAFTYYQKVAAQLFDVKYYHVNEAPVAAEAFIALANYFKRGLPSAGLEPNSEEAARLYMHVATNLQNPVGEYLLARSYLDGEGNRKNIRNATLWFKKSASKNYAPGQAYLAQLFWRGLGVKKSHAKALALIQMAKHNAEKGDLDWISDLHDKIMDTADPVLLDRANLFVAGWERRFGVTTKGSVIADSVDKELKDNKEGKPTGMAANEKAEEGDFPDIRIEAVRPGGRIRIAPANVTEGLPRGYQKLKPVNVISDQ